jgi:hypothetical protein
MYTVIVLVIGIFIGWNLPQPPWAKAFQDRILELVRALGEKVSPRA